MKLTVQLVILLSVTITGCSEIVDFISNYYYTRCVQKETRAGDTNAEEYCACVIKVNPALNPLKIPETSHACNQLSSRRAIKVEPFKRVCSEFDEDKTAQVGDIVQLYRTYIQNEWVAGVRPYYNGIVWELLDKNKKGVFLKLIEGSYRNLKVGDIKRMGDTEYRYYNPGSDLGDGIMKSLKVCKNYNSTRHTWKDEQLGIFQFDRYAWKTKLELPAFSVFRYGGVDKPPVKTGSSTVDFMFQPILIKIFQQKKR